MKERIKTYSRQRATCAKFLGKTAPSEKERKGQWLENRQRLVTSHRSETGLASQAL